MTFGSSKTIAGAQDLKQKSNTFPKSSPVGQASLRTPENLSNPFKSDSASKALSKLPATTLMKTETLNESPRNLLDTPAFQKAFPMQEDRRAMIIALLGESYPDDMDLESIIKDSTSLFRQVFTEEPPASPTPTTGTSTPFRRVNRRYTDDVPRFIDTLVLAVKEINFKDSGIRRIKKKRKGITRAIPISFSEESDERDSELGKPR